MQHVGQPSLQNKELGWDLATKETEMKYSFLLGKVISKKIPKPFPIYLSKFGLVDFLRQGGTPIISGTIHQLGKVGFPPDILTAMLMISLRNNVHFNTSKKKNTV